MCHMHEVAYNAAHVEFDLVTLGPDAGSGSRFRYDYQRCRGGNNPQAVDRPLREGLRLRVARVFEDIPESEEDHVDFLETQISIADIGIQNFLQSQVKPADD